MDQPITNYYINSARNMYSANLDFENYFHFPNVDKSGVEWSNKYKFIYFAI